MRRKSFILLLFIVMFSLIIAGCSSSDETGADENNVNNENTEGNGGDGNSTNENGDEPVAFSIAMRTFAKPYVENHPDINEDKYVKKLEELTNTELNIRLIPHSDYKEKMLLMLASDNVPDVMQGVSLSGSELGGGVEEGVFLPLDDLLDEHGQNLLEFIPDAAWEQMTHPDDGKIYAIPEFLSKPSRRG